MDEKSRAEAGIPGAANSSSSSNVVKQGQRGSSLCHFPSTFSPWGLKTQFILVLSTLAH